MQLYSAKPVEEFLEDFRAYACKAGKNRLVDAVDDLIQNVGDTPTMEEEICKLQAEVEDLKSDIGEKDIEIDRLKDEIDSLERQLEG